MSMKPILGILVASAVLVAGLGSSMAAAATLATVKASEPVLSGDGAEYFYEPVVGEAALSGVVSAFANGGAMSAITGMVDVEGIFDPDTAGANATATLFVRGVGLAGYDSSLPFLTSTDLEDVAIGPDFVTLLFSNVGSQGSTLFGSRVIVNITDSAFTASPSGGSGQAAFSISAVTPIPLPAVAPMLVTALFALVFAGRRVRS